jgi:hypothetical protein
MPIGAAANAPSTKRALSGALVAHGVHGYDLTRCVADYRLARLWNLHTLVVVGPLFDFSHPRAEALLVAAIERLVAMLDDDIPTLPPSYSSAATSSRTLARNDSRP